MRFASFAAPLLLAAWAPAQDPRAAALDRHLADCARFGFSGTVLVAREGTVLLEKGYGLADRSTKRPNDAQTLFEIASTTKQFTAAAILKLAEQKKLALDDPIAKHLPGVPAHSAKIEICHLLAHTAGISGNQAGGTGEDLERAVVAYLGAGPQRPPGERFEYWNGGYALLAGIIERTSGGSYAAFLERELFAPAGMKNTGFTGDQDLPRARAAIGASQSGEPRSALDHPYGAYGYQYRGMGGAVTTARDLYLWHLALNGEAVLQAKTKETLFTPFRDRYACGWMISDGSPRFASHGGSVRGFLTDYAREIDGGDCTIVLCNRDGFPIHVISSGIAAVVDGKPSDTPAPPQPIEVKAARRKAIAGTYRLDERNALELAWEGDAIRVFPTGLVATLALETQEDPRKIAEPLRDDADLAERIVRELAAGKADLLREHLAAGIPATWPDHVLQALWPKHQAEHGSLVCVTASSVRLSSRGAAVDLTLEHSKNRQSRVHIDLVEGKLQVLSWAGPEAPSAVFVPVDADKLRGHLWTWQPEIALEWKGARVVAATIAGLRFARER